MGASARRRLDRHRLSGRSGRTGARPPRSGVVADGVERRCTRPGGAPGAQLAADVAAARTEWSRHLTRHALRNRMSMHASRASADHGDRTCDDTSLKRGRRPVPRAHRIGSDVAYGGRSTAHARKDGDIISSRGRAHWSTTCAPARALSYTRRVFRTASSSIMTSFAAPEAHDRRGALVDTAQSDTDAPFRPPRRPVWRVSIEPVDRRSSLAPPCQSSMRPMSADAARVRCRFDW